MYMFQALIKTYIVHYEPFYFRNYLEIVSCWFQHLKRTSQLYRFIVKVDSRSTRLKWTRIGFEPEDKESERADHLVKQGQKHK